MSFSKGAGDNSAACNVHGGAHIAPEQFHAELTGATCGESDRDVILLDVRNFYESCIGHFKAVS